MKTLVILFTVAIVLVGIAEAQQPGVVTWWTLDGGAADSRSANYQLQGTVGQPDAGASSGGTYTANWGYWQSSPLQVIDTVKDGLLSLSKSATFGDIFKGLCFLIVAVAAVARGAIRKWSN